MNFEEDASIINDVNAIRVYEKFIDNFDYQIIAHKLLWKSVIH